MVVIKKYPNRRLYNTVTSSYINLDEIQAIIRDGIDVQIVESKSGRDVTTEMLLTRALDAELLEMLVPSEFVQQLFRMDRVGQQTLILDRVFQASDVGSNVSEPESETLDEADKTITRVDVLAPEREPDSSEANSESFEMDSDSEVTIVRVEAPPSEPAVELLDHVLSDEVISDYDVHISQVHELNLLDDNTAESLSLDDTASSLVSDIFEPEVKEDVYSGTTSLVLDSEGLNNHGPSQSTSKVEKSFDMSTMEVPKESSIDPTSEPSLSEERTTTTKSDELKAKFEAMRARFNR